MTGLPRRYPMDTYPYARDVDEEDYFRAIHYLASALYLFNARDEALHALRNAWQQIMDHQSDRLANPSPLPQPNLATAPRPGPRPPAASASSASSTPTPASSAI